MDVARVLALAVFLLAPLTAAAKDAVPVVQEFHEAMMIDPDNGTAMVADGEVPKEEEEGPNPMSNSDGNNYVGDKSSLDDPFVIIVVVCCILLFCMCYILLFCICMICKVKKRTEEKEERPKLTLHPEEKRTVAHSSLIHGRRPQ